MGKRLYAAFCAGLLAWFIGKAMNVPVWRDWDIGDRSDMALTAFLLVWFALATTAQPEGSSE